MRLIPDTTFADCPQLDLICVPGGAGMNALLTDAETLDFLHSQAKGARYVTSVCTGALVLGAAGLLRGRRATTHWMSHDMLAAFGAIPTMRLAYTQLAGTPASPVMYVTAGAPVGAGMDINSLFLFRPSSGTGPAFRFERVRKLVVGGLQPVRSALATATSAGPVVSWVSPVVDGVDNTFIAKTLIPAHESAPGVYPHNSAARRAARCRCRSARLCPFCCGIRSSGLASSSCLYDRSVHCIRSSV